MKYHVWTIGCQMNVADSRRTAARLEAAGMEATDRPETADVIVLNTCVVRQQAEDRIYGKLNALQGLKRKRPDVCIALMGCLVGRKPRASLAERFPYVDVYMPPSDPGPLLDYLWTVGAMVPSPDTDGILPTEQRNAVTAHVPAVLGCSRTCAYCIIPYRRGPERSRPAEEILEEVRLLAERGIREVVLLGQIIDRYGHDLQPPCTLSALLRNVADVPDLLRVRFLTNYPSYMTDELIETVADHPGICPHFEMPFQSGNDEVLRRMKRDYTAADYRKAVERIRQRIPDAAIHTDIIVGFPGETDAQFMDSYRLLEDLRLDQSHIARYSTRPQTYAARRYEDDVPEPEKERRRKRLDELQTHICAEKHAALEGRTVEVLVDGRDEKRGRLRGRTERDDIVFFPSDEPLIGHRVEVCIEHTAPFSLVGRRVTA